ncbi:MAG TPA: hypothetical protein VFH97_09520 [Gemmatimonadales bacterium]|nr:hypothetical protein [Gemmatimonadales bacterium]
MHLAARGARDMDDGEEPIEHSAELAVVRRQARRVRVGAAVGGTILAGVATVLAALV